jgi:RAT1-interacting protein
MKKKAMAEHSFVQKIPEIRYFKGVSQYKKPKEVAHFSYDAKRNLVLNSRKGLGLYDPKKLPIDLNVGYPEKYVVRSTEPEGITALLKSIKDLDAHPFLCTWRGIMTKIICAPYSNDEWALYATLSGNTIYLVENEENKDHSFGKSEKDKLMCYYGYNFENIVTKTNTDYATPRHWESADEDTVNTNIQYCSVFSSQLGPFPILLGGEVDCLYSNWDLTRIAS